ncbi:MAG: prolipoprotein diacylglyceryl transferase [Mobilitalea sp.]
MYPIIPIFGSHIGTYGLCIAVGGLIAYAIISYCIKVRYGKENKDLILAYIFSLAFSVLGAVLLKPVINIITVAVHYEIYKAMELENVLAFIFGEIVFYGGLLGGILGLILYCRMFKTPLLPLLDIGAVAIPMAHAIGRVGCLFGGCCWGASTTKGNPLSIIYPSYPIEGFLGITAPVGMPLWNVPLMEAIFLTIIFIVNIIVFIRSKRIGVCCVIYLFFYGIWRFFIEYIRGDAIRGKYYFFTTSQYISIMFMILAVIIYCSIRKEKRKETLLTELNLDKEN